MEKPSPKLGKFTVRHAMHCGCFECDHVKPKTSERERKRQQNYLNGR